MAKKSIRNSWASYLRGDKLEDNFISSTNLMGEELTGIVLGIDSSLRSSGFSIISYSKGEARLLESITLKLKSKLSTPNCLGRIANQVIGILNNYNILHVAIEQTIYVQNFQTAQILGAAKGASIAPAAMANVPVFEYAPLRVKQAVVGKGSASKDQVAKTVGLILGADFKSQYDESDASAVALCHCFTFKEVPS